MKKELKENVILAPYSTFRIGGTSRYFVSIKNTDELVEVISFAKKNHLEIFILGGGSNILFSDEPFDGIVIKIEILGRVLERLGDGVFRYIVSAGENWDEIVLDSVSRNLWGLENLSYIPGCVGASPVQNIGAYGRQVGDVIEWVEVYDIDNNIFRKIKSVDCKFSYRNSLFKEYLGKNFIVTKVAYLLTSDPRPVLSYKGLGDLNNEINNLTPKIVRERVISIRKSKLPEIKDFGTAGSFFKNPTVSKEKLSFLKNIFTDIPVSISDKKDLYKVSAAYLLDKIGNWRGYREGNAGVYDKHSLVIVNYGNAKSSEIKKIVESMVLGIKNKTGIILEPEVIIF